MEKAHELLSGEIILSKNLSKIERNAVKNMQRLIEKDPEGDGEGNFFELLKIAIRFPQNGLCYKVLYDIARRAGIAQNIIAAPEHEEKVRKVNFLFSVIPFATAVRRSKLKFGELRKLLENKTIEGAKVGNVWFVVFASLEDYLKDKN